jgi:probable rRNA maturation factor
MVTLSNRQRKIRLNIRQIEKDSRKALRLLGLKRAELSLVFAGPRRTRSLNLKYRGVDAVTDVLSFPLYAGSENFPPGGHFLLGDIVINPTRARLQADERGVPLRVEIRRLLVHGLLHLLGHDHEGNAYLRRKMMRKEQELLDALDNGGKGAG